MTDLSQFDGAEVVVLHVPAQIPKEEAREIGEAFPGWYV